MSEQRFTRKVSFELDDDGRTLEARIVPYNTPATVADPPDFYPYQEMFLPGAFDRQVNAAHRVKVFLNFEHEQGIRGNLGHASELRDETDGLHGTFRVHDHADGEKALTLVREGILTGLSVEFSSKREHSRTVDGITQRSRARLDSVALCRFPAYEDAQVLAVRTRPLEPLVFDPALLERLERLGLEIPGSLRVA